MHTEIVKALTAAGRKSQYDYHAKRLLANKWVLAYVLIHTIEDFQGMTPKEVVSCIEGDPIIGSVPTDPGLTNKESVKDRIVGLNSESAEIHEGLIRFDVVCYVRLPDGLSQIIVNIEAQKSEPKHYAIVNRAVFYGCRLISSQKERDFEHSDYNDIKRVFSVWICMNMSECILNDIHLTNDQRLGNYEWNGDLDLFNLIFIGLPNELPERKETYELHRLLTTLLSNTIPVNKKQEILEHEYQFPMERDFREDVNVMCNLSEGIFERGLERGIEQERLALVLSMHQNGLSIEQIAQIVHQSAEQIQEIITSLSAL